MLIECESDEERKGKLKALGKNSRMLPCFVVVSAWTVQIVQVMVIYGQVVSCVKPCHVSRGRKNTEIYVVESDWSCLFCFGVQGQPTSLG